MEKFLNCFSSLKPGAIFYDRLSAIKYKAAKCLQNDVDLGFFSALRKTYTLLLTIIDAYTIFVSHSQVSVKANIMS